MSTAGVQVLGYLASILVFAAFYMRTMLPLRAIAIASNVAFLLYGGLLHLWPVAALHALLLPLNIIRLMQARRLLADVADARNDEVAIHAVMAAMRPERHAPGTRLFRKGETGDSAFYIARGTVTFPELGVEIGTGQLFGEMALLSADRTRTASAVCASEVELYRIDEQAFVVAFHQNPSFAFALVHLVSRRMVANMARLEAALAERVQSGDALA